MFTVNLPKIIKDPKLPAVVRLAALQVIQADGYLKVGDWFKTLNDVDLALLLKLYECGSDSSPDPGAEAVVTLALILSLGEGIEVEQETAHLRIRQLLSFLVLELQHRSGVLKLEHDNMSFGDDAGDNLIATRVDKKES